MPRPGLIDRFATLRALGVALVFCIIGVTLMPASPALAFQDAEKPAGEEGATPAADAGDGAAEVDPGEKDAAKALEEKSFLMWMIEASGVFGLLILLLSFIMVALIMMNILSRSAGTILCRSPSSRPLKHA